MPESKPAGPRSPKPQEVVGSEGGAAPMLPPRATEGDEDGGIEQEPAPQAPTHHPSPRPKSQ